MPGQAFLMSGMGASFRPAQACPVMNGPHVGPDPGDAGGILVADAATRDGLSAVRVVLWRCRFCGTQLTGLGRADIPADDGLGTQEFTWLEEAVAVLVSPARSAIEETACG